MNTVPVPAALDTATAAAAYLPVGLRRKIAEAIEEVMAMPRNKRIAAYDVVENTWRAIRNNERAYARARKTLAWHELDEMLCDLETALWH